jgi:hypothetical protein
VNATAATPLLVEKHVPLAQPGLNTTKIFTTIMDSNDIYSPS